MLSHDRWGNSALIDAINYANRTGDSEPARILRAVEGRSQSSGRAEVGDNFEKVLDKTQAENLRKQTAMNAAAEGDILTLKRLLDSGLDANCADYDRRTPLAVSFFYYSCIYILGTRCFCTEKDLTKGGEKNFG